VKRIIPFTSRFTVAAGADRTARWRRVTLSAMKQSQRLFLPEIDPVVSFEEMLRLSASFSKRLLAHADSNLSVREAMGTESDSVFGLVGPEGGFSEEEIRQALDAGFTAVKLSDARLRAETAGTVLTAMVMNIVQT
jgi:16S rRNA (uracil1498-N3)-methyltransferase